MNFIEYVKTYNLIIRAVCNKSKDLSNSHYIREVDIVRKAVWPVVNLEFGVMRRPNNDFSDLIVLRQSLQEGERIAHYK